VADGAPWTIKAVPVPARQKAIRYARMSGETMGEWIAQAVDTHASKQDGNQVIPPGKPGPTLAIQQAPDIDLTSVAAALQAMAAAATAGLPVSKPAVRDTVTLIRAHVRAARGLPTRQTRRLTGQTISSEQEDLEETEPAI
jgi:hypothetical protein